MYEAHRTENNREGGTGPGSGGYLGTEPTHPIAPEGIHWGPGIPESSPHNTHHPTAPAPQLMGLKGKGCRADLSGNDRKKRGEAGGGWCGAGHGSGGRALQTLLVRGPQWSSKGGAHTHLSLECLLLRPPTGPHPHTHRLHLKHESQVVRGQQGQRGSHNNSSRKPPLGDGHDTPPPHLID